MAGSHGPVLVIPQDAAAVTAAATAAAAAAEAAAAASAAAAEPPRGHPPHVPPSTPKNAEKAQVQGEPGEQGESDDERLTAQFNATLRAASEDDVVAKAGRPHDRDVGGGGVPRQDGESGDANPEGGCAGSDADAVPAGQQSGKDRGGEGDGGGGGGGEGQGGGVSASGGGVAEAEADGGHSEELKGMRDTLRQRGMAVEDVSDSTLLRFLWGRSMNVSKAAALYAEDVAWRATFIPTGGIPASAVAKEIAADKVWLVEAGQLGLRSWVYLRGRNHIASDRDMEEFKRYTVFCVEKAIASLPEDGDGMFGVVADLQGMTYKNLDSRALLCIFDVLQAHYPERMKRLFMVHVPYVFWAVWKAVAPFIDKRTKAKILFVSDKDLVASLSAEIPQPLLLKEFGGLTDWGKGPAPESVGDG